MIALNEAPPVARSRKRAVAKSSKPAEERPMKIGLSPSPESWRRLGVSSAMEDRMQSDIVDGLIRCHLKKYVVQVKSAWSEDSASVPGEVSAP